MQGLRKRVLIELFVTPLTILPFTGGITLLLLCEILGSMALFFGLCGILVGIGSFLTNLIVNLEAVTERVLKHMQAEKAKNRDATLDELDSRLVRDRDPRDQNALRKLRGLYDAFTADLVDGKLGAAIPASMISKIDEVYNQCIVQLEKQYAIWEASCKTSGAIKERLTSTRNEIIVEVEKTVEGLSEIMGEVRLLSLQTNRGELEQLQNRLQVQLNAAKETDKLLRSLDDDNMDRFAQYLKS